MLDRDGGHACGLASGLTDVERLDERRRRRRPGALEPAAADREDAAGSSSGGHLGARGLEHVAIADRAVADERLPRDVELLRRGRPAGPVVNTSPRRASITGIPPRERLERRRAGDRHVERERQRRARSRGRFGSLVKLPGPRADDERVDARRRSPTSRSSAAAARRLRRSARSPALAVADERADRAEGRRGVKGEDRHCRSSRSGATRRRARE